MTPREHCAARDFALYIVKNFPGAEQCCRLARYLLKALDEIERLEEQLQEADAEVR